jgi:hypothetical protein
MKRQRARYPPAYETVATGEWADEEPLYVRLDVDAESQRKQRELSRSLPKSMVVKHKRPELARAVRVCRT